MVNYKESNLSGTEWQRCNVVVVTNPLNGVPKISFEEEKVLSIGTNTIKQNIGGCSKVFNPTDTFPLLNPTTNEPTGATMTHNELYVALYSLYMQTAEERDAQLAAAT